MATEIAEYTKTEAALADLRQKYKDAVFDVSTTKGMAEAKVARAELRTLRTDLEKERVRIKAPALERCRLIDSEAKRITSELSSLEDPIDDTIKAEENRKEQERLRKLEEERQRQIAIQSAIDGIRNVPASLIGKPAIIIKSQLTKLKEQPLDPDFFGEFFRQAEDAHVAAVAKVQEMLQAAVDAEAEAARVKAEREELERIRAENERLQREADDRRRADELRAQQEREAAEQREREARAAKERAERDRVDAIWAHINAIRNLPTHYRQMSVAELDEEIEALRILDPRTNTFDFQEFRQDALDHWDAAHGALAHARHERELRDVDERAEQQRRAEEQRRLEQQRQQQEAEAERQRQAAAELERQKQEHARQVEAERIKNLSLVDAARAVVTHYCQQGAPEPPKCIYDLAAVLEQQSELPHQKRQAAAPVKRARNAA